ncbi:MAG: PQQ-binding-like beta-propeller repeat protein, partial [Firmicutes bacterium]|nr:PQQ-binding-like beta-propeller repeat protein [Bacillota bacterium]
GDPRAVLAQEPMAGDPEPPGGVSAMPGLLSAAETKRVEVAGEVVVKGKPVEFASRESAVHMADEEMYRGNAGMNGVVTFRGSGMRQNAAYGKVAPVEKKLKQVWTASVGTPGDGHATWNTQPLIVQWQANLRELLPLYKDKLEKRWLKEVIFAGNDGSLYYVDAEDGSATRDAFPIDPPIPMLGSPSLYPTGMPLLMVGVGDPEDENPPREASLYIYNLIKHKLTAMVRSERPEARSLDLSYITSPVVDVSSSVMAAVGGNGVLYTMTLHPKIDLNDGTLLLEGATLESYVTSAGDRDMAVDSSPAAYGEYVYFATRGGILQSVHLNTLTTEWAIDLGAGTSAAVALEADHAGGQNALYTASQADGSGLAHIRRVNADTGEVLWDYALPGSCFASPLVGKGGIGGLVICTVSRSGAGAVCALDKETGAVMWEYGLGTDTMSSPVALYDDAGNAWVVQGDAAELHLLDGLTGTKLHSLPLSSPVIGSPAAFNDMIVLATQDAMLHGIALR